MTALKGLMTNAERFGEEHYWNADLSAAEYDAMFLQAEINSKHLYNESALMKKKWFDYRYMHFVEATYLFTKYYIQAYKNMKTKTFDFQRGPHISPFKGFKKDEPQDFLKISDRETVGMYRARGVADKLGINYEFYNDFAVKWCIETMIWKRSPRPSQLYSKPLLEDMVEAWRERCDTSMQIPDDERYELSMGVQGENQEDFQEWLGGQMLNRVHPEISLNTYMNNRPMITKENAIKHVGQQHVDKVI